MSKNCFFSVVYPGVEKYLEDFTQRLKKINKEDLIKLFITQKFKHILDDYKNTRDLNAELKPTRVRKEDGDNVNLKINFGKKNGFNVKDLFALLNSNKNLKGVEVGRINIMAEHSIFSVEKKRADAVVNYLKGTNLKGKKIIIGKSEVVTSYQDRRGNKSNRSFKKKKRGRKKY